MEPPLRGASSSDRLGPRRGLSGKSGNEWERKTQFLAAKTRLFPLFPLFPLKTEDILKQRTRLLLPSLTEIGMCCEQWEKWENWE